MSFYRRRKEEKTQEKMNEEKLRERIKRKRNVNSPSRPLSMISLILTRVGMHERRQRTPIHDQPRHERSELRRREEVHFEHAHGMRTKWTLEEGVDA